MTEKKILILSSIWGHESIAKGIRDALKDSGFKTRLEVIRIDPFSARSYKTYYRYFPSLFKISFQIAKYEMANKVLDKYFEASYFKTIEGFIDKYKPDVVISSYFAFDSSIEKHRNKYRFKYLNVVADPWSITRVHLSNGGINLVFDHKSAENSSKYVHASNIKTVGWFVENKFNKRLDKKRARKILGIDVNTFTFCITGGSEGTYDILKIINSFVNVKKSVQILFMCGKNKQLFDLATSFSKILGQDKDVKIFPYKHTSRMNVFMRASDLVIGKAGPNTIFESVACGVPFFAITHISGQEDGNLELIRKYKIGYVEENPIKISKILKHILNKPTLLENLQKPIQSLSVQNQHSRQKLLEILSQF